MSLWHERSESFSSDCDEEVSSQDTEPDDEQKHLDELIETEELPEVLRISSLEAREKFFERNIW